MPYTIQEDEIAITLENQEILPEVSKFADRELVHFEPPKSPNNFSSHEPLNHTLLDPQENVDFAEARKSEKPPSALGNNTAYSMNDHVQKSSMTCITLPPRSAAENRIVNQSPLAFQDTRVKHLLKTMDENLPVPTWQYQEKDSNTLLGIETPQLLPRLRQVTLRDTLTKKISWMGLSQQQPIGSFPFCTSGSRPPVFPLTQQQTLTVRSLKQSKEKTKEFFNNGNVRRNFAPLKHTAKDMDLNLPVLSLPFQTKSVKKSEILKLDIT
ncbi:uncharacterized protein LOC132586390 [Heteronotia binoei]|uniref:uncharacterized protein LOC132586390 n=1 Tax=Heteronotia binoei TaxID=13085 RepID=UPI00292EBA08|nr:uncharacterized protein LOC132586390 [Heteronotia binoei]